MPKLSIIIPVYGVEKYLREALDSILNQTFTDFEVLLIDDGGKDSCPQIIDEYAQKDSRIKALHKANGGYGHTCNYGLSRATGEYVTIFEPDDYIESKMYEDLYNLAIKHDADIVKSNFYKQMDNIKDNNAYKMKWGQTYNIPSDKAFKIQDYPQFLYFHPSIWSCIYKKEFLDKHNIKFVEAPGAGWTDNPFQVQTMCLAEKIVYTDEAYYHWRCVNINECDDLKDYTLPFKRSDEIHQWLEENHITDKNILENLYRRELAYIHIVLNKEKLSDEKDCYKKIVAMTKRMDSKIIYSSKNIWKRDKVFYYFCERNPKLAIWARLLIYKRKKLFSIRLNKREILIKLFGLKFFHKDFQKKNKINAPFDVGVMGFWYGHNYGSILTYFALNRVLLNLGKKVLMIENPRLTPKQYEKIGVSESLNRQFAHQYYTCSKPRFMDFLHELNPLCKSFILGSDQVFNPDLFLDFKNAFFLDFANKNKKRIAYAASFGQENFKVPFSLWLRMRYFLRKFDAISMRETTGVQIMKNTFGINSPMLFDPVFLCPFKYYNEIIEKNPVNLESKHILSYILDPNAEKRELILSCAKYLNKNYVNILDYPAENLKRNAQALNLENTNGQLQINEFLTFYKNADYIITDSFHGTCFAIIFQKQFIAIVNNERGATRFESILSKLGLMDRLVYSPQDAINNWEKFLEPIDYERVGKIIEIERERGINWLKEALDSPIKKKSIDLLDVIYSLIDNKHLTYLKYKRYRLLSKLSIKNKTHYTNKANYYHKIVRTTRQNQN